MTDEEAEQVKLIFAPEWPSKATSIEEIASGPAPSKCGVRISTGTSGRSR